MTDLRYPTGKFEFPETVTPELHQEWMRNIAETPARLRAAVDGMTEQQLDTPYRPGGWTVRQVVHHVADSHINSYVRFRLALTEAEPAVKGYEESLWAELSDAKTAPVEVSLTLLDAIHRRWVLLLESLRPEDFEKTFRHSERGLVTLENNLALYSWHGRHHTAHILSVRNGAGAAAQ